jgi:hypothetical protein
MSNPVDPHSLFNYGYFSLLVKSNLFIYLIL